MTSPLVQKFYITSDELLKMSFNLASKIYKSGYKPDWILAVWRGGAPVGMAVQELLKYKGIKSDHISVRTSSYNSDMTQNKKIAVHGLEYVVKNATNDQKLLIVDDIFDTGRSVCAILEKLKTKMRANMPTEIRVATVLYKPQNNKTNIIPDYFCKETNEWIVFPHEIEGMTHDEISEIKPGIAEYVV